MSTIPDSRNSTTDPEETDRVTRERPLTAGDADTIDITDEHDARDEHVAAVAVAPQGEHVAAVAVAPEGEHVAAVAVAPDDDQRQTYGPVEIDPTGRIPWRGMRIRRVRLLSVAKLSFIFWLLAFAVLLASTVLVWNVARAFGFISEFEDAVVTSLGIDAFVIDGSALFSIAAAVVAFVTVLGWVMTILLAAVYNASCAVFGGLAVETGPLKRRKRVFSLRHRGFVTIRS